jgi:hypothetical protein
MPAVTVETAAMIAGAALVVALVALLLSAWLILRTRRLSRLSAFRPQMPADLQSTVESEVARLDALIRQVEDVRARLPTVEGQAASGLQRIGIVRFNPFADTGGQQSFVVALLDARNSGVLISSLHSRQQTRVYVKQITEGRSETQLSDEETAALRQAGAVPSN